MSKKFLSFRQDPLRPMQFADKKKWLSEDEGKTFKLLSADIEKDKQYAYAQVEVKNTKALGESERLMIYGIANANIVDRMQERLDPRGLDLVSYMKNSQLLAHHSYFHPVGQVDAIEIQDDGVHFSAWIGDPSKAELTPMQKEIRSLVAQGILKTVSVGFIPRKVRAPLYDDQGNMTEPCVIESWELLELSVVAVPCNQDSVFAVRDALASGSMDKDQANQESLNDTQVKTSLSELSKQNLIVQELVFDEAKFTLNEAKQWAKQYDLAEAKIYFFEYVAQDLDQDEKNLTEGVIAVTVKKKEVEPAPAVDAKEDGQAQMIALMQQLSEGLKGVTELCGSIMAKLNEKPGASDEGGDEAPPPPKEDGKAASARIDKLEKGFDKLVNSVNLLVEKLNK